ncbi:thioredoxin-like protein [Immersiella caudata]|uniref:Glutathione S-transferase kappa n=1 Tax=Immersiella caudata TaxID=314043 RepID=A0AA39X3G9_9PEZI|nr:thioredoxin-like protein [Immersiella caudata]
MATARPHIALYVDVVSPFAYEAYHILRNDPLFAPLSDSITYIPIFLGGLMHKCGNTAPMRIANKDKWINTERLRWAKHFSIPISTSLPVDFPANTLPVQRALCALGDLESKEGQGKLVRALDGLYAAYWVRGEAVHQAEVLRGVLEGVFGREETERVLAEAKTVGKTRLTENTERAFKEGAFGLPWMVCTNGKGVTEGFWGVDHLGCVVEFMGLEREKAKGKAWKALL